MIGVAVITHNYARYLGRCLASLAAQTDVPDHIVVVDDGSEDNPETVAEMYGVDMVRIDAGNAQNARNEATRYFRSKGFGKRDGVLYLDADDWLHPNCLRSMWERLYQDADVAYASMRYISEVGFESNTLTDSTFAAVPFRKGLLERRNIVPMPSMVRFSCVVPFDASVAGEQDWSFWRQIAESTTRFEAIQEELVFCWVHGDSMTHQKKANMPAKQEPKEIAKKERADVLIVVPFWGPSYGGGELTMLSFARRLLDANLVVHVCARNDNLQHTDGWWDEIPCVMKADVPAELRANPPKLVLFQDTPVPYEAMVCNELGVPYIVQFAYWHNLTPFQTKADWDRIRSGDIMEEVMDEGRRVLWGASHVFANSEWMRDILKPVLPNKQINLCYPPISEKAIVKGEREPSIILLPQSQEGKGLNIFLQLARDYPKEQFVALNHLGRLSPESGQLLSKLKNVVVEEWVDDISDYYRKAKCVFVGTQTAETFCRAAAEARINGIPLLVSNVGNLPNICTSSKFGQMVPFDAPYHQWKRAFGRVLSMRGVAPVDKSYLDTSGEDAIVEACMKQVVGKHVAIIYPQGAPGVTRTAQYTALLTGAKAIPVSEISTIKSDDWDTFVLSGGFIPEFKAFVKTLPESKRVILWWHSSIEQMRWHPEEFPMWQEAITFVKERPNSLLFTTAPETAESVSSRVNGRSRWAPCGMPASQIPKPWLRPIRDSECSIPLLGPYSCRKRPDALVSAADSAGVHLRVSKRLYDDSRAKWLFSHMDVERNGHEVVDLASTYDVLEMMGRCSVAAFPAAAETFCYAAAEAMLAGLPVLATHEVPIARYSDPLLVKRLQLRGHSDAAVGSDLRSKLSWIKKNPKSATELGEKCKAHAMRIIAMNNDKIRRVFAEIA